MITQKNAMLKALKMSKYMKIKNKWSRQIDSSFICDDIKNIGCDTNNKNKMVIEVKTYRGIFICQELKDFTLRETEELILFLENEQLIFNNITEMYHKAKVIIEE